MSVASMSIRISFWLSSIEYWARILTNRISSEKKIDNWIVANNLINKSPAVLEQFLAATFVWRQDNIFFDFAKNPLVFFYDGRDDCDGFAMFYEYLFTKLGCKEVFRAYVSGGDFGHAVCVVNLQGDWFITGNWAWIPIKDSSLIEVTRVVLDKKKLTNGIGLKYSGENFIEECAI